MTRQTPDNGNYGLRLFSRVSADYPASVSAQAAAIVLDCRRQRRNIFEVRKATLEDPKIVNTIFKAANSSHKSHGKNIPLTLEEVEKIIRSDFLMAGFIDGLDIPDLNKIIARYRAISWMDPAMREFQLREYVDELLEGVIIRKQTLARRNRGS